MKQTEKLETIKRYIKEKKGVDVVFNLKKTRVNYQKAMNGESPFEVSSDEEIEKDVDLAYKYASEYFDSKKDKPKD